MYGETEFIFASIKVITIIGLLILGIILDLGGGPNHDRIGFRYWKNPGPFVQYEGFPGVKGRFLGWSTVMSQAAFSFIGTEVVAVRILPSLVRTPLICFIQIAGAEVKNPRRNIPKAIRRVYVRLLLFYIGGVTVIGLLVPSNDKQLDLASSNGTAKASPFVIAISNAGIKVLPSVRQGRPCSLRSKPHAHFYMPRSSMLPSSLLPGQLPAATSTPALAPSVSATLLCTRSPPRLTDNRNIDGLALNGNAPKVFMRVTRHGLPWVSVVTCAAFAFLAYMGVANGSGKVFGWLANMCALSLLDVLFDDAYRECLVAQSQACRVGSVFL